MYRIAKGCLAAILLIISACSSNKTTENLSNKKELIQYAKLLSIKEDADSFYIHVYGLNNQTTHLSVSKSNEVPYKKIVSLSSVFSGFFCEIDAQQNIAAVDDISFLSNPILIQRSKDGTLPSVCLGGKIDTEKLIKLQPDLIIHSGFGELSAVLEEKLKSYGITIFLCNNYLEESPLGRAEWIKAFGILCGKKEESFSLFSQIKTEYNKLAKQVYHTKPTVLVGILFNGIWDVPASKSYTAQLIHDAGGDYIWKNEGSNGRIPLSLEMVAQKALNADIWLHPGTFNSLAEMKKAEYRYTDFKAFKTRHIFNNNKQVNEYGGNAFWETAVVSPQIVLQDLIQIFHSDSTKTLNYYQRLNE